MNEEIQPNEEIQRVFEQALDLPTDRRKQFLVDQCGDNEAMRHEVESLLEAHANAGTFMQSPTAEQATIAPSEEIREEAGSVVDRYKLLEEIGVGGFGVVFMAQQTKPIRRRVALKIIKLGMDTKQVVARFEAERQALAMMDHPNIARVLDGGATDAGRPYFVMELVRGDPITEYCDREKLSMRDRLDLFNQVCNAVQHAHQKGIIHRDIKPSNVLVTVADGKPMVKVIDFGIAKATNSELTEKTLFTEFRQLIGTPQYMSPEQAERSGVDVDTRSDIYSLGVLLYEMLTGRTPVDARELQKAGWGEMQKIIREQEATLPSVLVSSRNDSSTNFAKRLGTEPARLGVLLKGDLDWIVLKAIEKDRNRRYATPAQLADDIDRYLNDEPVLATPPSTRYRLFKFYKRNRRWITAASIGVFALVLGLIATSVTSVWAMRERNKSVLAEQRAEKEFESALREKDRAVAAEARAAKEAAAARRMAMLAGSPLISDKEAQDLGGQWKGDIDELKLTNGADDVEVIQQECQYVSWLFTRGRHEETLKIAEDVIPRGRKILGPGNASYLSLITTYATVKINFGKEQLSAAEWLKLYEEMIESLVLVRGEQVANSIRLEYMIWRVKAKELNDLESVVDHYLNIQAKSTKGLDRLEFIRLRAATNALAEWGKDHSELYERMMALRRANGGKFDNPLATQSARLTKDLELLQGTWESTVGEGDPIGSRIQYKFEDKNVTVTEFAGPDETGLVRDSRIKLDKAGPLTVLSVMPKDPMPGDGQLLVYRFENGQLVTIDGLADIPGEKPPVQVRRWTKVE